MWISPRTGFTSSPPQSNTNSKQQVSGEGIDHSLSGFRAPESVRAGAGEISGELPYFGPLTWPMATGSLWYEFPKAGRFSIDLQRTYYLEEIIRGNDFQASLLMIRWTRNF